MTLASVEDVAFVSPSGCRCRRSCCYSCGPVRRGEQVTRLTDAWPALRASIIKRDGGRCFRCQGQRNLTVHHIRPRESGGTDAPTNLVTLCAYCHDAAEVETAEKGRPLNRAELSCAP